MARDAALPNGVSLMNGPGDQEDQPKSQAFSVLGLYGGNWLKCFMHSACAVRQHLQSRYGAAGGACLSITPACSWQLGEESDVLDHLTGTGRWRWADRVNNNIILIDTYQESSQYMPRIEAIIRHGPSPHPPLFA